MGGPGKNGDQINISLPKVVADEVKRRASAMGLSTSRYCFLILSRHLHDGKPLVLTESDFAGESGSDNTDTASGIPKSV